MGIFMSNTIQRIKVPLYQTQLDRVADSIIKGALVHGEDLTLLENRLKKEFNRKYAVLTANGFSAIFLTLMALNPKKKEVILPAISTCFSMVNAVKMAGYKITFADVDIDSMSLNTLEENSSIVLAPNHFGKIASFNQKVERQFTIEDSCQAFFSSKSIKNSTQVTILSFYPSKLINGIDGGVILTDNPEIYHRAKSMVYYSEQECFEERGAFNMRLNNINASFTLATMEHMDEIEKRLTDIYQQITERLKYKKIKFLEMEGDEVASKLLLQFSTKEERDDAFNHFKEKGIEVSLELRFIAPTDEQDGYINAKRLVDTTLSLPFHPLLTNDEIFTIIEEIKDL